MVKDMKILLTNTGPWGTGSFTVAKAVLQELQRLGHEVMLFFPDSGMASIDKDFYYSQNVYRIWEFPYKWESFFLDTFPLIIPDPHPRCKDGMTYKKLEEPLFRSFLAEIEKQLLSVIEEFSPDIIECQHIWLFDWVVAKTKKPFICTAHHSDQMGFYYDERARPWILEGLKFSSYVFAVSKYVAKEVEEMYPFEREKIVTIENGYDQNIFFPQELDRNTVLQKKKIQVPQEAILVSFSGKISRTKGIDILLKANAYIKSPVYFLLMGAGDVNEVIFTEDKENICLDRVHFLGHVPPKEVAEIHNICHFHVMPSRSEGFGIAALEAMGCALPVIATKTGGLSEFVVGKFVPVEDSKKLAEAIENMAHLGKEDYEKLSQEACKKAHEFSWKEKTKVRLEYYQKAIESARKQT